jgi:hypothetical protein
MRGYKCYQDIFPKTFFNHSFTTTVFEADTAVKEEWVSKRVCLLLENSSLLLQGLSKSAQGMPMQLLSHTFPGQQEAPSDHLDTEKCAPMTC